MTVRSQALGPFLTSAEAAALLGVSASTVKRWVDDGTVLSERTLGGHRRIRREVVDALLQHGEPAQPDDDDLLALLLSAQPGRDLEARLIALRAAQRSVGDFADALTPALHEMGARWARGELAIADEHIASERLARALARLAEWTPVPRGAPVALLATAAEEEHTLGLSLAELCLRENGWEPRWVGRRTPTDALVDLIARARPPASLVVLSASVVASDAHSLLRQAQLVARACHSNGATLVLGGDGAWPLQLRHTRRVRSIRELEVVAQKAFPQAL